MKSECADPASDPDSVTIQGCLKSASIGIPNVVAHPTVEGYISVRYATASYHTTSALNMVNVQQEVAPLSHLTPACPLPGSIGMGIGNCYSYWLEQLSNHECVEFANDVLSLVREGSPTGYEGPMTSIICDNWPSTQKFSDDICLYIQKHIKNGAIEGPLPVLGHGYRCSPLGAFEKQPGKVRVVHDLSWPPGRAVNDYINKEEYSVRYTTVLEAVQRCSKYNSAWLAKTDLSDAYLYCPIRYEESDILGFQWYNSDGKPAFFKSVSLILGLRSAPFHFEKIAHGLEFIAKKNGVCQDSCHYLDDFLMICGNEKDCKKSLDIMIDCAERCGFKIKESKTVGPSQTLEFLGITIDTVNKSLYISEEKLVDVKDELVQWYGRKECTKRELLSLIGRLQYCSQVVQYGSMFIRRLIDLSTKVKSLYNKLHLNEQCRKDINWWIKNIKQNNCKSWFPKTFNMCTAEILLTDSSGYAAAAVLGTSWTIQ